MPDLSPSFPLTQWTLLQRLREGSEVESAQAMETLCRAYWYPLYAVARRRGLSDADAQDATQGLFLCLLKRETLQRAEQERGKLRNLLLAAFEHYLSQQWRDGTRQKRGGGAEHLPWADISHADERYVQTTDANACDVETFYRREWARSVLERCVDLLGQDYARRGWQDRFAALSPFLAKGDRGTEMVNAATGLGVTAEHFRVLLHRLRQQYREIIHDELAQTLDTADPAIIKAEIQELFRAFTAGGAA